jgi:hypothetical protein
LKLDRGFAHLDIELVQCATMKSAKDAAPAFFYLYCAASPISTVTSGNVFYCVGDEKMARTLIHLFIKNYPPAPKGPYSLRFPRNFSSKTGVPYFFMKPAAEVEQGDRVLLDEALESLAGYDDPDRGVYEPAPRKTIMELAEYAKRARDWEAIIATDTDREKATSRDVTIQTKKPSLKYPRSELKRAIRVCLTRNPQATDKEICGLLDDDGIAPRDNSNLAVKDRTFASIYRDPLRRAKLERTISKVRGDMRQNGMLF